MENSTQLPINVAINVSNATINKTGQSLDGPPVIRKLGNEPRNKSNYKFDIFRIHGSVIPTIMLPATLVTSWAVLWVSLFKLSPNQFKDIGIPPLLITLLSIVIGLLLVFRTNTAYDRYWEARKLWGTIFTHTRNLSRFFWITVKSSDKKELEEKYAALNLLMAYSISVKHYLRNEAGYHYEDLHNLLIHLPDFEPGVDHSKVNNLPMEISLHISSYISKYRSKDLIDPVSYGVMINTLSAMIDCLSNFERIRDTPVPVAYTIHLKQTLILYLLSLPFQLVSTMHWLTIGIVAIASFTLLGIEAIGHEIENPFGYDDNDLHMESFCDKLKEELIQISDRKTELNPESWSTPVQLSDFAKFQSNNRKN